MARSSPKKPNPAKCRGTGAVLEGRDRLRIGGNNWSREAAEKAGKFVPIEYREGYKAKTSAKAAKVEEPVAAAPAEEEVLETTEEAEVETEE